MLTQRFGAGLAAHLRDQSAFRPYPTIEERAAWNALPARVRAAHIQRGMKALGCAWPALTATRYLEFSRIGNRSNFETPYLERRHTLQALTLAECMEGEGRFLDDIVNGVWAICEESSWCLPAHIRVQRAGNTLPDIREPIVDLFAAETAALLAWTLYLLGARLDAVSALVRPRVEHEIHSRVLLPCLTRDDFWWMGFVNPTRRVNNWNPWICSNWLAAALIVERDPARRGATVARIMRALDHFIDLHPADGGCDEGPNYWGRAGASLFDSLELLHAATDGWINVYSEPLIQDIGRYICRAHIAGDFYLNFADASAIVQPDALLVYRYGLRIGDAAMVNFGRWLAHRQKLGETGATQGIGRAIPALFALSDALAQPGRPPLPRDVWLPDLQVMAARDAAGCDDGFYLAAKGGHNDESHNHNDIGSFVVFIDGRPALIDAGVETYTAKTFSERRYDIWTMQSAYHTLLPTVDGAQQQPGAAFAARDVVRAADDAGASLTLDIAGAYSPAAKLARWQRTVTLRRGAQITIVDAFALTAPARRIELSLLTPCAVTVSGPGQIALGERAFGEGRISGAAVLTCDTAFHIATDIVPISDARMQPVWGDHLTRILLTVDNPPMQGVWRFEVRRP